MTIQEADYKLKDGTSTSYYWQRGSKILPNRLSISLGPELTSAERKGRMLIESVIGEVKGTFTKPEQSPLKQHPPFGIHSKIFRPDHYPNILGYSTIGISNADGKITRDSEQGFAAFIRIDPNTLKVFFCVGITNPSQKDSVLEAITRKIERDGLIDHPQGFKND